MNNIETINEFRGMYAFLSNFYPCVIVHQGVAYPSVEHAFQGAKFKHWKDRIAVAECGSPGKAKQLGRTADLPDDWEETKLDLMYDLVTLKFGDPELERLLIDTGKAELVEGNIWGDTFWGVCRGEGENFLGRILMRIRQEKQMSVEDWDDEQERYDMAHTCADCLEQEKCGAGNCDSICENYTGELKGIRWYL